MQVILHFIICKTAQDKWLLFRTVGATLWTAGIKSW